MGDIVPFNQNKFKQQFQNVKIVGCKKDFQKIKISTNQSCLNFKIKKQITDQELKIIYKELVNMLSKISPEFHIDILPHYMNYVVNYCSINKIPITKDVYIEQLDCLRHYLEKRWNYKIEKNVIEEEKEKLTELMQRR